MPAHGVLNFDSSDVASAECWVGSDCAVSPPFSFCLTELETCLPLGLIFIFRFFLLFQIVDVSCKAAIYNPTSGLGMLLSCRWLLDACPVSWCTNFCCRLVVQPVMYAWVQFSSFEVPTWVLNWQHHFVSMPACACVCTWACWLCLSALINIHYYLLLCVDEQLVESGVVDFLPFTQLEDSAFQLRWDDKLICFGHLYFDQRFVIWWWAWTFSRFSCS